MFASWLPVQAHIVQNNKYIFGLSIKARSPHSQFAQFNICLTVSGLFLLSRSIVEKHSLIMVFLDWQNNYKEVRKHNKPAKQRAFHSE